jgi:hypothetical protein
VECGVVLEGVAHGYDGDLDDGRVSY